jgi:hypothetical protein
MAFVTRIGLSLWPQVGDTLEVYPAGADRIVGNLVGGLTDVEGGSGIANPYTVPAADFMHLTTPTFQRVDIWWVEGGRYLVENAIIRGESIDLLTDDPVAPVNGEKWINTVTNQFKIKTSTGTIVIEAFQFVAD